MFVIANLTSRVATVSVFPGPRPGTKTENIEKAEENSGVGTDADQGFVNKDILDGLPQTLYYKSILLYFYFQKFYAYCRIPYAHRLCL